MTKVAVLNDTHFGVRNSSDIFIEYHRKFFEEFFFPYLKANSITHILHLGDLYDNRKYINYKVANASRKMFLEPLRDFGLTMDIIPGNHDLYYRNTSDLMSLKEMLGYFTSNVNVVTEPRVVEYGSLKVGLIPWINAENYSKCIQFAETAAADWVGAHLELDGFEMMRGVKSTHGMSADIFSRFERVLTGHFHTKSDLMNIQYLGSQLEFTWADAGDPKYFHVIDTETREIEAVRVPYTIFERVVYDDSKDGGMLSTFDFERLCDKFVKVVVARKTDPYEFDRFIEKIQDSGFTHDLKIAESFEEFAGENVSLDENTEVILEDTADILDSYVEATETDLDHTRLKELMRTTYIEACNTEVV